MTALVVFRFVVTTLLIAIIVWYVWGAWKERQARLAQSQPLASPEAVLDPALDEPLEIDQLLTAEPLIEGLPDGVPADPATNLALIYLVNDDITAMDFVVTALHATFELSLDQAYEVMREAHTAEESFVQQLPLGQALARTRAVMQAARTYDYPLMFVLRLKGHDDSPGDAM